MVPDSRRRLRDAMDDLEASIVSPVCVCVLVGCALLLLCACSKAHHVYVRVIRKMYACVRIHMRVYLYRCRCAPRIHSFPSFPASCPSSLLPSETLYEQGGMPASGEEKEDPGLTVANEMLAQAKTHFDERDEDDGSSGGEY